MQRVLLISSGVCTRLRSGHATRRNSRDPERIDPVLEAIRSVWSLDPDLRLSQLVVNAARFAGRDVVSPELFSLEDDMLLNGLNAYEERLRQR